MHNGAFMPAAVGYKAKTHTACRHKGVGYAPLSPYLDQNKWTPPTFMSAVPWL